MKKETVKVLKRYAFLARKQGHRLSSTGRNGGGWLRLANDCGANVKSKSDAKLFLARMFGHPDIYQAAGPVTYLVVKPRKQSTGINANSESFLESYEWRKTRMEVLKRDGARCACCGNSRLEGRIMHVDHIKPRKTHPELALDLNNLQVLCDICNHGKGNWDQTDWR